MPFGYYNTKAALVEGLVSSPPKAALGEAIVFAVR